MKNGTPRKTINVDKPNRQTIYGFKELDNAVLRLSLYKNSIPFDVEGQTIRLGAKTSKGIIEQVDGFTINANELDIELKNSILVPGVVEIDLELKDANGIMTTASFFITVESRVLNDTAVQSTNEFDTFSKTVAKVEEDYNSLRRIIIDENQAANLQDQVNKTNAQLDKKANLNTVFGMANMGQDIKEAMTGGSVAVVGKNAILRDNIVDGQITFEKFDPVIRNEYEEIYEEETLTSTDGYLRYTGDIISDAGWKHWSCNAIPNYKYKVSGQSYLAIPMALFLDSDDNVISFYPTTQDSSTTNYVDIELIAPVNATKIVVNRMLSREYGIEKRIKIQLTPSTNIQPTKLTIIGDSLSADDSPQATAKYHSLLSQKDNYVITNLAKGGHGYKRCDDGDNAFYQQATKIPSDTDMVFVFGGFNDLGKVINGEYTIGETVDNASTSTNTIMECINKTITNIRAIKKDAIIVIASATPWASYHPGGGVNKNIAEQYVKAIETVAHNQCCIFLDLFHESNVWSWNSGWNEVYCTDGVHLNDLGHERFLYPIIRNTLNKVNPNI